MGCIDVYFISITLIIIFFLTLIYMIYQALNKKMPPDRRISKKVLLSVLIGSLVLSIATMALAN